MACSCCSAKAISITYSERVFVALGIQYAMRMRHIVICGMSGSTLFFHLFSQTARFSGGGVIEHKMCFGFLLQMFIVIFLILGRNKRDMIKNVHLSSRNVRYSCQILMKLQFSLPIFEKKTLKYKIS